MDTHPTTIDVTAEHIRQASRGSALCDPISIACGAYYVGSREILPDAAKAGNPAVYYALPPEAVDALARWDAGHRMAPFSFTVKPLTDEERQRRDGAEARERRRGGLANFRAGPRIEPETALAEEE